MLPRDWPIAIHMEGALGADIGKMGYGVLRYSANPIVAVIDSSRVGENIPTITGIQTQAPVVSSVEEAIANGAKAIVLGIAPPGGHLPEAWRPGLDVAVGAGLSIVNGLHDRLAQRYTRLRPGQWIWDMRVEPPDLQVGAARAATLRNRRVLTVGADMAVGKMTTGLELWKSAIAAGFHAEFVATGQIGIAITGWGVPLDAVRVDYASGAIEREVLSVRNADLVIVEGQGSLVHPGSTATLPLLRGACPTHLVLCHRAGQTHLRRIPTIRIPPLRALARLYEELAATCGVFPRARVCAASLNTVGLDDVGADRARKDVEDALGVPCVDPVRNGAQAILDAVLARPRISEPEVGT